MPLKMITLYCFCDDFLKSCGHREDEQAQMTTAEVLTTALVAAWFFGGNLTTARAFLQDEGYVPTMLSKSRFTRRLHQAKTEWWETLLRQIALSEQTQTFLVDSCPLPVCHYQRAGRCHLSQDPAYFG